MDRASDSGSEGWGFESLPVYQKRGRPYGRPLFWYVRREGLEQLNAARMSAAADGWTEANRYQHPLGADENESLPVYQEDQMPFGIWSFCAYISWSIKDWVLRLSFMFIIMVKRI